MQPLRGTLGGVRGTALVALLVIPVAAATAVSADQDTPHGSVTAALAGDLVLPAARALERCHGAGALVRTTHGHLRAVSLSRGLLTYEHKAPGSFVRLCLPAPGGSTP